LPFKEDDVDDAANLLVAYIEDNKSQLIKDWIESRPALDSGVYRSLPEADVLEGSDQFLSMVNKVLVLKDEKKAFEILEDFLEEIIQKRVLQGVNVDHLIQGSILHRETIIEKLRKSDLYKSQAENSKLLLLILLFRRFEVIHNSITKIAHEAAVKEIDRLSKFNEEIIESVTEGIIIEDKNGMITFANPKFLNMLKCSSEELLGKHWEDTVPRDQLKTFKEQASLRNLGIDGKYEGTLLTKDGERVPVLISARTLYESGKFKGVLSVITDIKDIKRMQNDLHESKKELERLNVELERYSKQLEEDNIRLRATLNIQPVKETPIEGEKLHMLESGFLFLMLSGDANIAFKVFEDLVRHGHPGLCVTRALPDNIRKRYSLEKTPIVWLTTNKIPDTHCISPSNIVDLSSAIIKFIERSDDGVVIMEGVEYLISQNSFRSILNLIQLLNDKVMLCNARIILPLDPEIVEAKDLHLLKKEVKVYDFEEDFGDVPMMAFRK
jgi:two-component system cell cycle response regulator